MKEESTSTVYLTKLNGIHMVLEIV